MNISEGHEEGGNRRTGAIGLLTTMREVLLATLAIGLLAGKDLVLADGNGHRPAGGANLVLGAGEDCNENGVPDARDLFPSPLDFQSSRSIRLDTSPGVGKRPRSVISGDFNADGAPDLATANMNDLTTGEVSVLLGDGDGFFGVRHFAAGANPSDLVAADFDGDTILDLAVANSAIFAGTAGVSLLRGNGDGTFQPPRNSDSGRSPVAIVAADLNGDDDLDLATADYGSADISVLLGNGDGTFQAARSFGAGRRGSGLIAAHLDGDAFLDLAAVNDDTENVSVLLGNGDGSFRDTQNFSAGGGGTSSAIPGDLDIHAADLNADGFIDIILANASFLGTSNTTVVLGNGDGTFQPAQTFGAGENPHSIVAADLDADGILDLAAANFNPQAPGLRLALRRGKGDGTFEEPVGVPVLFSMDDLLAADLNVDGILDIAVVFSDTVLVLLGEGKGEFKSIRLLEGGEGSSSLTAADLNADGNADLVAANFGTSTITVLLGNGAGALVAGQRIFPGQPPAFLLVADLNSDGILDLLSGFRTVLSLLGNGDGTFQSARAAASVAAQSLAAGDLNGDGAVDLIARNDSDSDPRIVVLLGRGNGTFAQSVPTIPVHSDTQALLLADLNHDDRLDLLAGKDFLTDVEVRLGRGNGSFGESRFFFTPPASSLLSFDADGDGNLDIVAGSLSSQAVFVLRGSGDGSLELPAGFDMEIPFSLLAADLNGDAVLDLVGRGGVVLVGNRDGSFQRQRSFFAGGFGAALDVNGDGALDLVAGTGQDDGPLALLISLTAPPFSSDCNGNSTPDECDIQGGASQDINANGIPDECENNTQIPGDCNQDGFLDIADIVCVLLGLFEPEIGRKFPCNTPAANDALLDWNDSGSIDLSDVVDAANWLFLAGTGHALGSRCKAIVGCPLGCAP